MLSSILLDLSFGEVVRDIPHDAGALVVYLFVLIFVGMVWAGGRNRTPGGGDHGAG